MSEAEAEAPVRLLRPVPPMGLAKDAREQELAVRLRGALLRRFRFNEYNDLGSRLQARASSHLSAVRESSFV